ncbi:hypothetical protein H0H87_010046, partial [Tephrocybe sp. NHM501043]
MDDVNSKVNNVIESIMLDLNRFNLDTNTVNDRRLPLAWGAFTAFCEQLEERDLLTDMPRIKDIREPTERKSLLAAAFEAHQKGSWKEFLQH